MTKAKATIRVEPQVWLTVKATAAGLGVERITVQKWIERGNLPSSRKHGRDWMVLQSEAVHYQKNHNPKGGTVTGWKKEEELRKDVQPAAPSQVPA